MPLLDHRGRPVSSEQFRKASQPRLGEAAVSWGNDGQRFPALPMGGIVQFNLDNLQVQDFRAMRDHYQVNASLAVLSFMQHQSDWHVECDGPGGKKIAEECEYQLRQIWTPLNRSLSTANWAGYSPNILQWENDTIRGKTYIDKIKDLIPEGAEVNWRKEKAWVPTDPNLPTGTTPPEKFVQVYDGIKQIGSAHPIPAQNTLWFPMLMENGDHKGRKLLKAAFSSWYFSILIHLFANRYYERFGEPIVVGRAPFDDYVKVPGTEERLSGIDYMVRVIKDLRNRSVVALPDEKTEMSNGRSEYDYQIEYLESQMRGADWERYLTRLDEEISIGLFTPILLLRTADVGSYNLGVGHMQMYLWMLNAMNSDRAVYIDKYILNRIADINFSPKSPRPHIKFRKLGNQNAEMVKSIIDSLLAQGKLKFDVVELGEIAGMSMEEIQETITPTPEPTPDEDPDRDPAARTQGDPQNGLASSTPRATTKEITARIAQQVENHRKNGTWGTGAHLDMGFRRKMAEGLQMEGVDDSETAVKQLYGRMNEWIGELQAVTTDKPQLFMDKFVKAIEYETKEALSGNR